MTPKPAATFSWDEIDALTGVTPQRPPANAFNAEGYAAHVGISKNHAGKILLELHGEGKLERIWWERRWWYWKG